MAGDGSFQVRCACGEKLRAPASAAGKKGRCPGCGATLSLTPNQPASVPATATTAAKPMAVARTAPATAARPQPQSSVPASASVSYDDLDALDEYDVAEESELAAQPARISLCPGCRSQWDAGAVLCVKCGFDTRTGKSLAAPVAKPSAYASPNRGKPQIDMMAPQGSFYKGLLMSAIFAGAASLLWIGFAWATHYELRFIAFLIGGCAGAGMKVGQDGFSAKGGTAAAGMTAVAIMVAKFAVIELIIAGHHSHLSIFDLRGAALGLYFFNPFSTIMIAFGMVAAFRTANGSFTA